MATVVNEDGSALSGSSLLDEIVLGKGVRRMPVAVPKAVRKIAEGEDELPAFFDVPAGHGMLPRTTNPLQSTSVTVRPRTKVAKGVGSRAAGSAMGFQLVESAQARWRAVIAPHLVERPEQVAA